MRGIMGSRHFHPGGSAAKESEKLLFLSAQVEEGGRKASKRKNFWKGKTPHAVALKFFMLPHPQSKTGIGVS